MGTHQWIDQQVNSDYSRARMRSFLHTIVGYLRQEPRTLLPFEEVRSRVHIRGEHDLGMQTVALNAIVGSEGRYSDFDRLFLPRHDVTRDRWKNIDRAHYNDIILPPIELYKLGQVYFVRDGNHRVSVARQQDQRYIDARVIELVCDVPISPSTTTNDLNLLEERSDFLEWTGLSHLRPAQNIEVSQAGGYLELIRHINGHRYFKCLETGVEPTPQEAVESWYDTLYCPILEAIEQTNIMEAFPGRTPTDLYLWIMDHRHYLTESEGMDPGASEAVLNYTRAFGSRRVRTKLPPAPSEAELEFLKWSGLRISRQGVRFILTDQKKYELLKKHILDHQFYLGKNFDREVDFAEAVQSWFDIVYTPIIQAIHQQQIFDLFPNQSESDLYFVIAEHLHYRRGMGQEIDAQEATRDYTKQFGGERGSLLTGALHMARRFMRFTMIGS